MVTERRQSNELWNCGSRGRRSANTDTADESAVTNIVSEWIRPRGRVHPLPYSYLSSSAWKCGCERSWAYSLAPAKELLSERAPARRAPINKHPRPNGNGGQCMTPESPLFVKRRARDSNPEGVSLGGFQALSRLPRPASPHSMRLRFRDSRSHQFACNVTRLRPFASVCAQSLGPTLLVLFPQSATESAPSRQAADSGAHQTSPLTIRPPRSTFAVVGTPSSGPHIHRSNGVPP